jgi:hypothetical protein
MSVPLTCGVRYSGVRAVRGDRHRVRFEAAPAPPYEAAGPSAAFSSPPARSENVDAGPPQLNRMS